MARSSHACLPQPAVLCCAVIRKAEIAIVGAGRLARALAPALRRSGYGITQIIGRSSPTSRRQARQLAALVGARTANIETVEVSADLVWLCVPDREIHRAAAALAAQGKGRSTLGFHSSGALTSRELSPLRKLGISVASVHPLMTFVSGAQPALVGVPFALEGDPEAVRAAERIVADLGGDPFRLAASRKAAYHAWATMTSPLLLAFLVTLEEAGRAAGLTRIEGRRKSLPIVRQTLENYSQLGPGSSFSGPIIRGDVDTVARHLSVLRRNRGLYEVYAALARSALQRLPAKNRKRLQQLLKG